MHLLHPVLSLPVSRGSSGSPSLLTHLGALWWANVRQSVFSVNLTTLNICTSVGGQRFTAPLCRGAPGQARPVQHVGRLRGFIGHLEIGFCCLGVC